MYNLVTQWRTVQFLECTKSLKFPPLNIGPMSMCRIIFHMVTDGVAHSLYRVVTLSEGKWRLSLGNIVYTTLILLPFYCYLWLHTMSNQWLCASYLMDTPNLGRYEASWEVVPLPYKTSNCGVEFPLCDWGRRVSIFPHTILGLNHRPQRWKTSWGDHYTCKAHLAR